MNSDFIDDIIKLYGRDTIIGGTMTKWDKEYIKLCKKILDDGVEVENRTGINTIKIPSYYLHFDLEEEFPVLTTKQLFF